ncbi:MAG: hypothetical protein MHPSP_001361 [Paramarteilia canceri]
MIRLPRNQENEVVESYKKHRNVIIILSSEFENRLIGFGRTAGYPIRESEIDLKIRKFDTELFRDSRGYKQDSLSSHYIKIDWISK